MTKGIANLDELRAAGVNPKDVKGEIWDSRKYLDVEGVRIDARRLDLALKNIPGILREELLDALDHIRKGFFKTLYFSTGLRDRRFIATKRVGIGRHLRVYRNPRLSADPLDIQLGIFSRSKIVKLHEKGGEVTAKGKMLAIPIKNALDPSTGRIARSFWGGKKSKEENELFVYKSKNGRLFLMKKEEGKLIPYFVLRNKIKIQPRLRFFDTWDRMEGYRMNTFNKHIDKALKKGDLA
ncbi:MAG: hypothetical protein HZB36_02460 [Candidatus Omnitrophica bacterium]|nr:hypothetical protein [Candidatus Omnitrophota bacterium]